MCICVSHTLPLSVFTHCELLQPYVSKVDDIVKNWVDYKFKVPVYGGILLNPGLDKVTLPSAVWTNSLGSAGKRVWCKTKLGLSKG